MSVLQSIGRSFPLLAYAAVRPNYRTLAEARVVNKVGPFFTNHWVTHHRTNSCTNQEGTWGHVALRAGKALPPLHDHFVSRHREASSFTSTVKTTLSEGLLEVRSARVPDVTEP
ncbi:hypothetical protein MRX96_042915 [Rhipicephalus microplus]